jgi:hypothetical protein
MSDASSCVPVGEVAIRKFMPRTGNKYMLDHNAINFLAHIEAIRLRINALDVAATGITEGIRNNTLNPDSVYQLLDMLASDLKARADRLMELLQ